MKHVNQFSNLCLLLLLSAGFSSYAQHVNESLIEELIEEKTHGIKIGETYEKEDRSTLSEAGAEPFIAVDKTDSLKVGISFMGSGGNWKLFLSEDGGISWAESNLNTLEILEDTYPDHSLIGGGDPVFTFGPDHSLHVSWIYLHGTDLDNPYNNTMECFYAVSYDFGETWESRPYIHAGLLSSFDAVDRIWIDCDHSGGAHNNNIYLSAVHFVPSETGPAGQVAFVKPADESNFNPISVGGIIPGASEQTQFGNIAVDEFGNVHMSAAIVGGATEKIAYSRSTDGGSSFSEHTIITEGNFTGEGADLNLHNRENAAVSLAVDGNNVYIAWTDFSPDGVKAYYAYSHDNGLTFSSPVEFASEINGGLYAASMPCVSADNDHLAISWYLFDKETIDTKYISAYSIDAGLSLIAYQTLSLGNTDFSSEPASQFFGDYNDAAMSGCTAHFTWCDGNTGTPKVYHSSVMACGIGLGEASLVEHTPVTENLVIGHIYPNPVADLLQLPISSTTKDMKLNLEILTIKGEIISQEYLTLTESGKIVLNVSTLPSGTYLLKGTSEDGYFFTRRWVKE